MNSVCVYTNLHIQLTYTGGKVCCRGTGWLICSADVQLCWLYSCGKSHGWSPLLEGFHVIEVLVESCSKGVYACGGEGSMNNNHQGHQHRMLQ